MVLISYSGNTKGILVWRGGRLLYYCYGTSSQKYRRALLQKLFKKIFFNDDNAIDRANGNLLVVDMCSLIDCKQSTKEEYYIGTLNQKTSLSKVNNLLNHIILINLLINRQAAGKLFI